MCRRSIDLTAADVQEDNYWTLAADVHEVNWPLAADVQEVNWCLAPDVQEVN
jgi:hypothetical protein